MFCFWRKLYQGLVPYQPLSPGGLYAGTQEHLQLYLMRPVGKGLCVHIWELCPQSGMWQKQVEAGLCPRRQGHLRGGTWRPSATSLCVLFTQVRCRVKTGKLKRTCVSCNLWISTFDCLSGGYERVKHKHCFYPRHEGTSLPVRHPWCLEE